MKTIPFLLILLLTLKALPAQSPAVEEKGSTLPEPPLIKDAASQSEWTMVGRAKIPEKEPVTPEEIRNRKLRQRYSPLLLEKRVIKDGFKMVIYANYEGGLKSEAWVIDGYTYETPLREGESIRSEPKGNGDFPEITWIDPSHFRGSTSINGRKAFLYETSMQDEDVPDARLSSSQREPHREKSASTESPTQTNVPLRRAYIDAETRLPLVVDDGAMIWTYQFNAAPASFPLPSAQIRQIIRDSSANSAQKSR